MVTDGNDTPGHTRPGHSRGIAPLAFLIVALITGLTAIVAANTDRPRAQPYTFHGLPFDPPRPAPDFTLTNQDHQPVRLSDYRGKPVLLYFGFTNCRTTLAAWKRVYDLLGTDAEQVRFVFLAEDMADDVRHLLGQ